MRIAYDAPVVAVAPKAKGPAGASPREVGADGSAVDTFATLLALAAPGGTPATDGSAAVPCATVTADPGETGTVTETHDDETAAAAAAVTVMAGLLNLTGPPLEITSAITAVPDAPPSLESLDGSGAVALADLPPTPDETGADALTAARDALAGATVTTTDADGSAAPATLPAGTAPKTAASSDIDAASGADASGAANRDVGPTSVVTTPDGTDAVEATAPLGDPTTATAGAAGADPQAIDRAAQADASVSPLRPGAPAAATATERPIAPTRVSEVMLAAARASTEADRPVRLTVRLDPPNLGEVRVEVVARNGTVTVRVEPVHEAAAPLLSQQRQAVADALGRTGFTMASFDVMPGEPQRERTAPTRRTVRVAEATTADDTPEPTEGAGRLGLRI